MGNEEEEEGRDAPRGNYSRRGRIFTRGVEARVDEMNFSKNGGGWSANRDDVFMTTR